MTKRELIDRLLAIRPGAHWSWAGDPYENLVWLDAPDTKPTPSELGL